MRYAAMWPKYAIWWDRMAIAPHRTAEFQHTARKAIDHKDLYLKVEKATSLNGLGVKWYHVAILHIRESSANFATYLGNGQPLDQRTTIVPRGRGPFLGPNAFVDGCVDALRMDGLSSVLDWRLEKILYYAELFNGAGYTARGLPSPYVWGGTNIQRAGKFVRDGVFDSEVWDTQPGCAPLLWMIAALDPSVQFTRES